MVQTKSVSTQTEPMPLTLTDLPLNHVTKRLASSEAAATPHRKQRSPIRAFRGEFSFDDGARIPPPKPQRPRRRKRIIDPRQLENSVIDRIAAALEELHLRKSEGDSNAERHLRQALGYAGMNYSDPEIADDDRFQNVYESMRTSAEDEATTRRRIARWSAEESIPKLDFARWKIRNEPADSKSMKEYYGHYEKHDDPRKSIWHDAERVRESQADTIRQLDRELNMHGIKNTAGAKTNYLELEKVFRAVKHS